MTLAHRHLTKFSNESTIAAFWADAAVVFATVYACYIPAVYYLQLTYVKRARADPVALSVVQYYPGSAIFAIDILGYLLLSVSTICLALSLSASDFRILTSLLYFHGFVGLTCILVPFLPMIYEEQDAEDPDYFIWQLPLISWCAQFLPICFMMAKYFQSHVDDGMKE